MEKILFSKKQHENIGFDTSTIECEVNEGTPRSGKTFSDVLKMARFYMTTEDNNHLILAYNQEQVFRMFIDANGYGLIDVLRDCAEIKHDERGDHLLIRQPNGREVKVYYKGGGKINARGAITGMTLGSVVFLEYDLIHPEVVDECFRRTMAAKNRYHLMEMNPPPPNHPNLEKVEQFRKDGKLHERHWDIYDNPVFTKERRQSLFNQFKGNKYRLDRDWYGLRVMPEGVVYSALDVTGDNAKHISKELFGNYIETVYMGDGGSSDATTVSMNVITHDTRTNEFHMFRVANYYHSNSDTGQAKSMDTYAKEIIRFMDWCGEKFPFTRHHRDLYIDPACKALRTALQDNGVNTFKADNNAGDKPRGALGATSRIETGIEFTQINLDRGLVHLVELDSFEDPIANKNYGHDKFIREAGLYVRHDVTKKPIDGNNHAMDEFRYSNNYFYKQYLRR